MTSASRVGPAELTQVEDLHSQSQRELVRISPTPRTSSEISGFSPKMLGRICSRWVLLRAGFLAFRHEHMPRILNWHLGDVRIVLQKIVEVFEFGMVLISRKL